MSVLIASENLLSEIMYPGHTISGDDEDANGEVTGNEAFRVANGRRSSDDYFTGAVANKDLWIECIFDRPRLFNFVALDRDHNLDGYPIELRGSSDSFSTYEKIVDPTLPDTSFPSSDLRVSPGAKTEEGAWLHLFDNRVYHAIRFFIPAMGAGLTPKIVGLHIGYAWEPTHGNMLPFDPSGRDLVVPTVVSDTQWTGADRPSQKYDGMIRIGCADEFERDTARLFIETMAWRYRPTWWVPDQKQAEQSWYGQVPGGRYSFVRTQQWPAGIAEFPITEMAPRIAA